MAVMWILSAVPLLLLLLLPTTVRCQFEPRHTGWDTDAAFNAPITQSPNINIFQLFQPRPRGGVEAGFNQGLFNSDYQQNLNFPSDYNNINWNLVDRRHEEGWWHLYPFGERYYDQDLNIGQGRPWHDQQIVSYYAYAKDLDFFLPYYGFRYNYTFIFPEGFIAFSYPWYIQPPYTFPTPKWPDEPDPSLIAAFMSAQSFMHIGEHPISHVWYRIVQRPVNMIGQRIISESSLNIAQPLQSFGNYHEPVYKLASGIPSRRTWGQEVLKIQQGRIEDPATLDLLTDDIREAMVGARGFVADYALIVTWERMGYGGAPKSTELNKYEQFKKWQNTYQMVVATDEIRTYCMFNYGNVNWTSSTSAGSFAGRGGRQSALVGFNGGNGTGFFQMPYSAEGNSYKLVQYGSAQRAGRWLARIDENIEYGGCTNTSTGILWSHIQHANMLGGFALNVSGPCLRDTAQIKLQLDEFVTVDCQRLDMVIARCVIPVNSIYRMGMVSIKLSVDGGKEFNFWNKFYILAPARSRREINLIDDPLISQNHWRSYGPENLTLTWPALNLTWDLNTQVDLLLWGYWEDVEKHEFVQIGSIATNIPNKGSYFFNPKVLQRTDMLWKAWQKFHFGVIQVRLADNWVAGRGDGIYWSTLVPFGWYFYDTWDYQYGRLWAFDKCIEWFDWDGHRDNFYRHLETQLPCPCTLAQAQLDIGRYFPLYDCDMAGDSHCYYTQGALHCVISSSAVWNGAGQQCCYDINGWLMFSQDWEYNIDYLRFYSAGVANRAHPYGSYPFKRPPYIPSLSNFYNDLMPYEFCCKWSSRCEFFYWRRETSGCMMYQSPVAGFAYGEPHFITFDGSKYSFSGKGYFVLSMIKSPQHNLMVQVRMEEPPKTIWDENVLATVITGVAAQDNQSDVVQIFARKELRDWRYKMDVFVAGVQVFFDTAWQKTLHFYGVTLFSPARNMNTSEIHMMFATGVGIRVMESRGILDVMVVLPPSYNESYVTTHDRPVSSHTLYNFGATGTADYACGSRYRTMGLLGSYNQNPFDDFLTPDCQSVAATFYPQTPQELSRIYYDFGLKWSVEASGQRLLFQEHFRPLYNPLRFAANYESYKPVFDPWSRPQGNRSLIFKPEEVKVLCQGSKACEFDYLMTGRREIALDTLIVERKSEHMKVYGEQRVVSCGPLQKNEGVIKYPSGNNYLDGVTVSFACKPEYFLHGSEIRTCNNGTWSEGWWVWCRDRREETALKWFTGIITTLLIIGMFTLIFLWCYCLRRRSNQPKEDPKPIETRFSSTQHLVSTPSAAIPLQKPLPIALEPVQLRVENVAIHNGNGYRKIVETSLSQPQTSVHNDNYNKRHRQKRH